MLLVVQGVAEHSGRYGNLADFFAPEGFAESAVGAVIRDDTTGHKD